MGLLSYEKICSICEYRSPVRLESFHALTLPLPNMTEISLVDCFRLYTRPEVLHDYQCPKCTLLHLIATTKTRARWSKVEIDRLERESREKSTQSSSLDVTASASSVKKRKKKKKKANSPVTDSSKSITDLQDIHDQCEKDLEILQDVYDRNIEETLPKHIKRPALTSKTTRITKISSVPDIFAIHMGRSIVSHYGLVKNRIRVHYPEILDLSTFQDVKYSSSWKSGNDIISHSLTNSQVIERILESPKVEEQPESPEDEEPKLEEAPSQLQISEKKCEYRLQSLILHYGGHDSGHFVAIRRFNNRWFYISDESVRLVHADEIQEIVFDRASYDVYMLFYEKVKH